MIHALFTGMVEETPNPLDEELAKLKAAEDAARTALTDAVFAWGAARAKLAYFEGRKTEREAFSQFILKWAADAEAKNKAAAAQGGESGSIGLINQPSQPSPRRLVLDAMKEHPGLRGADLLKKIHEKGISLHERTFRTVLHRLKVPAGAMPAPGHILAVNNRWYRFEDAPPEAIELLREARKQVIEMLGDDDPKENGGQ